MNHIRERRTARWVVLAALAVVTLALWSASASAQPQPPFLLYGEGEPGDIVTVTDAGGQELGMAVVTPDGVWHMTVMIESDNAQTLNFQVNGTPANAQINRTGADQAKVTLVTAEESDDSTSNDSASGDSTSDDSASGDSASDEDDDTFETEFDSTVSEDDSTTDDESKGDPYPDSGSGGLADSGPSTEALIGTIAVLVAVGVIGVAGVGVRRARRTRNRA